MHGCSRTLLVSHGQRVSWLIIWKGTSPASLDVHQELASVYRNDVEVYSNLSFMAQATIGNDPDMGSVWQHRKWKKGLAGPYYLCAPNFTGECFACVCVAVAVVAMLETCPRCPLCLVPQSSSSVTRAPQGHSAVAGHSSGCLDPLGRPYWRF
jgi:hypothetical protein